MAMTFDFLLPGSRKMKSSEIHCFPEKHWFSHMYSPILHAGLKL